MKYPDYCTNIIDVTKPPYNADNTGKTDCTAALCQALDDILARNIKAIDGFYEALKAESENFTVDTYSGFEAGRVVNGKVIITSPLYRTTTKILYFPKGTYLVSDTVTYTLKNLKNKYYYNPQYELNNNIHFLGEDRSNTEILLADNSRGFEKGAFKPVIAFYSHYIENKNTEVSNVSFANSVCDITVDTGNGNDGAVGIRYHSSNCGRIENVDITGSGFCGIETVYGSSAVFDNVTVAGFEYGFNIIKSSMLALDEIDCSSCTRAAVRTVASAVSCNTVNCGALPLFEFLPWEYPQNVLSYGRYFSAHPCVTAGDKTQNILYAEGDEFGSSLRRMPKHKPIENEADIAFVNDYGAVADGKTDCSRAIQRAFDSGKPFVLFGEGQYLVNGFIRIPATVRVIDFMYCDLAAGNRIIGGEVPYPFVIDEDSSDTLFAENLLTWEQFYGHCHLFCHNAKRTAVFKNIYVFMSHPYINTVAGSEVYFDNCFSTTGTYTNNSVIDRGDLVPVYSSIVPYEFHGQTVYGRQINAERADIAVLNDNSRVLFDCFRTEGPGTALKCIGGRTQINLSHSGIGQKTAKNPLYDINGEIEINCINAHGYNAQTEFNLLVSDGEKKLFWLDADKLSHNQSRTERYSNLRR